MVTRARDGDLRAFQCLSSPRTHRGERIRCARDVAMPVPRLDIRARRAAARSATLGSRAWVRRGRARAQTDPGRDVGPVHLRESRSRRGSTRGGARRCARATRGDPRRRYVGVPLPRGVRARGELEDLVRELPRSATTAPLRTRVSAPPSTFHRTRTGSRRAVSCPVRSGHCARTATRSSRTARCRAASFTSSGRISA